MFKLATEREFFISENGGLGELDEELVVGDETALILGELPGGAVADGLECEPEATRRSKP